VKTSWIVNEGWPDLLLFFNGWGMDKSTGVLIQSAIPDLFMHDVLLCYDYRDFDLPATVRDGFQRYRHISLVAWSLGVWAALHADLPRIEHAVAVNGTPDPVSDIYGIPTVIFQRTLDNYSDENRIRFQRRMFSGAEFRDDFPELVSLRSTSDQRDELSAIWQAVREARPCSSPGWQYGKAFIGGRDMVFPVGNQINAWQGTPVVMVNQMPHYPFFHLGSLREVIACPG
jgi:biotin synthesis protein BioG